MKHILGSTLLVAGTSIGAGMIALPIVSASTGFFYSISALFVCWFFACYSGLLVIETNSLLPGNPSYISMAEITLGPIGKWITWLSFLFLFYSLLAAYISGGGAILLDVLKVIEKDMGTKATIDQLPSWAGTVPWMLIFGSIIFAGVWIIDGINKCLMAGLVLAFLGLSIVVVPHIKAPLLLEAGQFKMISVALPIFLASFGYHIVIPSLRHYLKEKFFLIKRSVILGSLFTLVIYVIWELFVFGNIPLQGDNGLLAIWQHKETVTGLMHALSIELQNNKIIYLMDVFAFFALATSFLGVSFGLFDLIADGLHRSEEKKSSRFLVSILTFLPPLIYAVIYPKGFIIALNYAAIFVAVLHGLLPVAMVYSARKKISVQSFRAPGGFVFMFIATVFFIYIIIVDVINQLS